MLKKLAASALTAAGLILAGPALAQHDVHHGPEDRHGAMPQHGYGYDQGHGHGRNHHDMRGAGPRHDLYKGGRLPPEFRHRNYVVDNWRAHRLSAPPRGYHWVQVGGDYVLVANSSNVILQIMIGG